MSSSEDISNEEDNTEESSSYDSSDEDSFDESKIGIALELPKRENRGKKYTQLVGEELEKDQQFWGHSTWEEDEVDDDYNCSEGEEQYAYSTDSDFDDPEEEETEEVDESHLKDRKKKKYGAYVDPMLLANKRTLQAMSRKKAATGTPTKRPLPAPTKPMSSPEETIRARRETTKQKTEAIRELVETRNIKRKIISDKKSKPRETKKYTQEELIEQAKRTEEANRKSLQSLQAWEDERKRYTETKRFTYKGHYDIWISWNSLLSVVNPNQLDKDGNPVETMPPHTEEKPLELYMFTTGKLPEYYTQAREDKIALNTREAPKCAVTGENAKYFDPLTRKYYSSVEAFQTLRVQYDSENLSALKSKLDSIGEALTELIESEEPE